MPSEGPNSPASGTNDNAVGTVAWTDPGNITADDGVLAIATTAGAETTNLLVASNLLFAIPAGATVSGFLVEIKKRGAFTVDGTVRLLQGGSMVGDNKADTLTAWPPSTPTYVSYGGSTDLWGTTWTPAQVNAVDFGVALSAVTSQAAISRVDHVRITVTYVPESEAPPVQVCRIARAVPHPGFWQE